MSFQKRYERILYISAQLKKILLLSRKQKQSTITRAASRIVNEADEDRERESLEISTNEKLREKENRLI